MKKRQLAAQRFDGLQQCSIDDKYPRAAVVEEVLKILGAIQGVQADGDCADLDGPEERLGIDFGIQQEKSHPLFHAHIQGFQGIAKTVDPFLNLPIAESPIFAANSDLFSAPFADVTIHEEVGGIECLREFEIVRHDLPPLIF